MATRLKSFDFSAPSKLTTSDKATYPWDDWLDGDIWQLTSGEDFDGHPLMMERIIRTRATGRRAKINLRHVPMNGEPWGIIVVQRNDVVGPAAVKKAETAAKRQAGKVNGTPKATTEKATVASKPAVKKAPAVRKPAPVKSVSKKPQRALAAVG
jgi:hypothetical protein